MNEQVKKVLKYLIVPLIVSLVLEIFVFNFNHFISLFYPRETKIDFNIYPKGMNYFRESDTTYYFYVIEMLDINAKINNFYLNVHDDATINLYLTDEANKNLYDANVHNLVSTIEKSNYIKLNTSGKTTLAKFEIQTESENLKIDEIIINKTIPIFFNFMRFLICAVIMVAFLCFKNFKLFLGKYDEYKYKYVLIGAFIFVFLGLYLFINFSSRGNLDSNSVKLSEHHQYALLARSLSKGKFTIDLKVSDKLLSLENPYDQKERDDKLIMNEDYYLDFAYYEGKYYSYFGVVPCILLYLPYYLITGNNLNTALALLVTCSFYILSAFYLVYQIFKSYFPKASFKWYFLFSLLLSFSSGISYIIRIGHFYGLPITMGAAFAMMGLGLWLNASREEKINSKYLTWGSICLALVAGCRPQILLTSFLIFPIFWRQIKNKDAFKIKNLLSLAIPYVIVAALLMYYNYARFGSVFDFGANYNLTSNDMTKRGFVLDRIGLGIFSFIFDYPRITPIFPFIDYYKVITAYHGITISEEMAGGFLAINIIGWINIFIFKLKKLFKDKKSFYLCLWCLVFAIIIVIADTQMAGIIPRYICDFGFLITISTIILAMTILNNYKGNVELVGKLFVYIILLSFIINFLIYFTDGLRAESNVFKDMYYYFYYLFMFWL